MHGVHPIEDGWCRILVGLALYVLVCQCRHGATADAATIDISVLGMDGSVERARTHLEAPQGVSTGDSNGTWGAAGTSDPVSIPWQELWDDVTSGTNEVASTLGRVRMDVRDVALEPLADLIAGQGGDVCIISNAQSGTGLATWFPHFLSASSSPARLHLISVGLWVRRQQGLERLRSTVTGRHVSLRTIEGLSYISPLNADGAECQVGVVDLDSLNASKELNLRSLLRSLLCPSTIAALGLRHVVLFTTCHDSPLPFPLLAATMTSWSLCIQENPYPSIVMFRDRLGRFYDVDLSHAATSAAVQAVMTSEEELWVGEQHCRRAKAARGLSEGTAGEAQDQQQVHSPAAPMYIWITLCLKSAVEGEQPRLLQSLLASLLLPCQADLHVHITVNDVAAQHCQVHC